jgi:hypothetical protein
VIDRSQCPATRHGDRSAYVNLGCRCEDAKEDKRLYDKRYRTGRPIHLMVPSSVGAMRRMQALMRIGYDLQDLSERLGWHRARCSQIARDRNGTMRLSTYLKVRALYDELSMTPGPSLRAKSWAAARGYMPPLCWSDESIDDPSAVSEGVRRSFHSKRSHAETAEEYTHFKSLGMSDHAIARVLGLRPDSLSQALLRAKRAA